MIGHPVFRANITGPGLATYRGPRGPSMVNAQSKPSSKRRAITANPRSPPREELPCAVPYPSHSITLRVHCPSNAVVFITTTPWFRYHRSEEHTSELQSRRDLVCRLLLEKKK